MSEKTLKSGAPPCPDRYKSPACVYCKSSNTTSDKTVQMKPLTRHEVKCRNCGKRFAEITRTREGVMVVTGSDHAIRIGRPAYNTDLDV